MRQRVSDDEARRWQLEGGPGDEDTHRLMLALADLQDLRRTCVEDRKENSMAQRKQFNPELIAEEAQLKRMTRNVAALIVVHSMMSRNTTKRSDVKKYVKHAFEIADEFIARSDKPPK
jgi:hypothetical protein